MRSSSGASAFPSRCGTCNSIRPPRPLRAMCSGLKQSETKPAMKANRLLLAVLLSLCLGPTAGFAADTGGGESKFFFEFYGDKLVARGRPPNVTYVVKTISTISALFSVNTGTFNPMTGTSATQVSFSVGDFSHSATLSQDPQWSPGKTTAKFVI